MTDDAGGMDPIASLASRDASEREWAVRRMTMPQKRELIERWRLWAHEGQDEPTGDWRTWLMLAGRGFGKTRAGAEWVSRIAREGDASLRIALVGATVDEVRKVMVEGESGLIAVARTDEDIIWVPTRGTVTFASGARAFVYSGEAPEKLRGPEHHVAWCDEVAKWAYPEACWDNLALGLRLGDRPRAMATTTPRPIALLKRLLKDPGTAVTRGRTADNPHLPEAFTAEVTERYGGTRLGRQELDGELIEDVEGALWTRALIETSRAPLDFARDERMARIVVGVDPPASAGGDACGIVACGLDGDGIGYVLGDHSVRGHSPEGWASAVAAAAEAHGADRVVVETNQGGEMVQSVLKSIDAALPVSPVRARFGKGRRAEPVAILFERGKAKLAGAFPELEDELTGITRGGYEGPGRSPDRADAMVWALTELMLGKEKAEPRVTIL